MRIEGGMGALGAGRGSGATVTQLIFVLTRGKLNAHGPVSNPSIPGLNPYNIPLPGVSNNGFILYHTVILFIYNHSVLPQIPALQIFPFWGRPTVLLTQFIDAGRAVGSLAGVTIHNTD